MSFSSQPLWESYLSDEFKRNLKQLSKSYPNAQQREDFKEKVRQLIEEVLSDPLTVRTSGAASVIEWSGPEGAPGFMDTQRDSQLMKAYFRLPHQQGARGQGRVLYLVHPPSCSIDFLMCYTHAEYSKRPPDSYLKGVFREADVPRDDD